MFRCKHANTVEALGAERDARVGIESALHAVQSQVRDLEAELAELRTRHQLQTEAASETQAAAMENLQLALRAESAHEAMAATRTWKMHDRYVGSRLGRWSLRRR